MGAIYKPGNHLIQSGLQFSYDDYIEFNEGIVGDYIDDGSANAVGLYVSDTWQIVDRLKATMGVRADRNTVLPSHDWFFGGRAALVFQATDDWTTKLMYNNVVKMPAPMASRMELWGANNNNLNTPPWARLNDTANKPERLSTIEWQNILYFDDRSGRASITLYHQQLQDFISWGGPWTNLGDFQGFGLEGDIQHRLNKSIEYWANFSYLDSIFDTENPDLDIHVSVNDEDRMIGSPRFTANAGLTLEFIQNLFLSPSVRYLTKQAAFDIRTSEFKEIDNRFYLDAALLWDDAFSVEQLSVQVRIKNILDNRKYISGSWLKGEYQPEGINGNISIAYEF